MLDLSPQPASASQPTPAKTNLSLVAPTSAETEPTKQHFPPPAELPTQLGPGGLRYDFNRGVRVALPDGGGPWRGGGEPEPFPARPQLLSLLVV